MNIPVLTMIALLSMQPIYRLTIITRAPDGSRTSTAYDCLNFQRLSHGHFQFTDQATGQAKDLMTAGTYSYFVEGFQQLNDNQQPKKPQR